MARKHRRNFLPTFVVNFILWLSVALIIFKLSPDQSLSLTIRDLRFTIHANIILFLLALTLSLTLTLALVFGHTRRGLFLALFFDACLLLRLIKQATWLNFFLILALFLTTEFYFSLRQENKNY